MRAIRFRGKDENGKWVYGFLSMEDMMLQIQGSNIYRDGDDSFQKRFVDPETIGQFTGLFDRNGKEIYEGDLVRLFGFKNYQVAFERGAFCYVTNYGIWPFSSNYNLHIGENGACPEVGIVGNIHDNPELLDALDEMPIVQNFSNE